MGIIFGKHSYGKENIEILGGSRGKITVGKYCSFGFEIKAFMSNDHKMNNITTFPMYSRKSIADKMPPFKLIDIPRSDYMDMRLLRVNIGNDIFVGSYSTIFREVTIGDGAVIGAFSTITKDVPPYSVVVGNDRIVKKRFSDEDIEFLLDLKWWDFEDKVVADLVPILCSPDINALKEYVNRNK